MSNERIDDFLSWRNLLDQPEALPEHGLDDREASWERLTDRFRQRPRRRFTGYRIAAACILLALIPATRFFQDRHGNAITLHRPVRGAVPPAVTHLPQAAKLAPKSDAPVAVQPAAKARPRKIPKPTSAQLAAIEPAPTTTALPASLPETIKPIALVRPPKREYKVININELNGAQPRPHGTATNHSPGFIRIGLGDPNTHGDAQPGQPSDDPPGLKIKLSSQN